MTDTTPAEGIFAVYKEVDAVRRCTGRKKVGHAGTLDPGATGVLVIGVGRPATRKLGQVAGQEKEYVTRVKLGARSSTDDREGEIEPASFSQPPSCQQVREALKSFQGHRSPPPVSKCARP